MRRNFRAAVRALISCALVGAVGPGCSEDGGESDPRPSADEVQRFYERFCERGDECIVPSAWPSVAACADAQVDQYGMRPTACLNLILDYHQCVVEQDCGIFENPSSDRDCIGLKNAVLAAECGEESLNL